NLAMSLFPDLGTWEFDLEHLQKMLSALKERGKSSTCAASLQAEEEVEEVEVPIAPAPSPPALQDPIPTPHVTPLQDQPSTPHASPPQEQPTTTSESSMSLLTTLMETCATLSQKVAELEQDKHSQALVILQLKKREDASKRRGKIEAIDADEDITLVDVEKDEEGVSVVEPTIFDDEEVTMTMAQTLIKLKAEKAKLLDEHIAQKLYDEEVQKAAARDKQEKDGMEELKCFRNSMRTKKIILIRVMLQNRYKMEHFRGMTYDKVRPIFEREYKKESFKKLRAAEVSSPESSQEIPSNNPKVMTGEDVHNILEIHTEGSRTYWKIIKVGGITEAYQSFKDMLKGFDREDLVALCNLVKEKFSSAVPSVDKEKALCVKLKRLFELDADDVLWKLQRYTHAPLTWKMYTDYGVHHVSSTRGHDIFM
nr:hypothetical protein [Tanacetum cinerariifolium]